MSNKDILRKNKILQQDESDKEAQIRLSVKKKYRVDRWALYTESRIRLEVTWHQKPTEQLWKLNRTEELTNEFEKLSVLVEIEALSLILIRTSPTKWPHRFIDLSFITNNVALGQMSVARYSSSLVSRLLSRGSLKNQRSGSQIRRSLWWQTAVPFSPTRYHIRPGGTSREPVLLQVSGSWLPDPPQVQWALAGEVCLSCHIHEEAMPEKFRWTSYTLNEDVNRTSDRGSQWPVLSLMKSHF